MNKYLACTVAFAMPLAVSATALAQSATTTTAAPNGTMAMTASPGMGKLSATDKHFIMKAAQGGMAEVQLAQLAQQKSQDDNVKKFAQKMIDDHTPANSKLTQLATSKGDTPPADIDATDQKMMTKLQGLDGKKFDTAYLKGQVNAHKTMLKLFEEESKRGSDPDLKQFADSTIPVIQSHITMAQSGNTGM